jgi:hypothetical protein
VALIGTSPTGGTVNSQPAKEWDDMSETQQREIKARLMAACDTRVDVVSNIVREQLERASRSGLAARLAQRGH